MFRWELWQDVVARTVRTFCQTLVATLGGSALNIWTVGWHNAVGVSLGSALLAFLMAVDRISAAPRLDVTVEPVEPVVEPLRAGFSAPVTVACGDSLR